MDIYFWIYHIHLVIIKFCSSQPQLSKASPCQERPKLPTGPPLQKMLSPELAADIAGTGHWLPWNKGKDACEWKRRIDFYGLLGSSW